VAEVHHPGPGGTPELAAHDRRAALVAVELAPGLPDDRFEEALEAAEAELRRLDARVGLDERAAAVRAPSAGTGPAGARQGPLSRRSRRGG
jgi:hypothetical protein